MFNRDVAIKQLRSQFREVNRNAAMHQAIREEEIKINGGLLCKNCGKAMALLAGYSYKWQCTCSTGVRFQES